MTIVYLPLTEKADGATAGVNRSGCTCQAAGRKYKCNLRSPGTCYAMSLILSPVTRHVQPDYDDREKHEHGWSQRMGDCVAAALLMFIKSARYKEPSSLFKPCLVIDELVTGGH